jgi:hypothetical protein
MLFIERIKRPSPFRRTPRSGGATVQPLRRLVWRPGLRRREHRGRHAGERLLQRDQFHPGPGGAANATAELLVPKSMAQ